MKTSQYIDYLDSPLGPVEISASDTGVEFVYFAESKQEISPNQITDQCKQQLIEYFDGKRKEFELPLAPKGTNFQRQVWKKLAGIPYGETKSYSDIAVQLNNPKAVRAVGAANGKNPISIIVPCHRVIGSNGTLTGYAGGLKRKSWLLNLENPQEGMVF